MISVFSLLVPLLSRADGFGYTLPSAGSYFILPAAASQWTYGSWATNVAYPSGARRATSNGAYMCVVPGTSSATNIVFGASVVNDNGVIWRRPMKKERNGFSITFNSTGDVYVVFGGTAANGEGTLLKGGGGPYVISSSTDVPWQGTISVYTPTTCTVNGQEW